MSEQGGGARRAARWYRGRLLGLRSAGEMAARNLSAGIETGREALQALRPKGRLTKDSFKDQYSDGGIRRFHELSAGMSEAEINNALRCWDRDSSIYMLTGCGALAAIPVAYLFEYRSFFMLIGGCILAATAFALSMKSDFRAWQIRQGRIGSVRDYFKDRLPSNIQIITKDRD
ncbi:hypothetical protein [Shinella sumterensis]|jgi:hypothetical protein|uniref:Uncharacterized protein n=1 Tax=Shinella sumterensis TaxID=1967501 RepID=A0AA50CSR1_9HYPH|nr:hypothetical protein [Shinella sumterensis]WLS01378.1 hypothetical protein Q9313_28690 [Shinella sumterensis]